MLGLQFGMLGEDLYFRAGIYSKYWLNLTSNIFIFRFGLYKLKGFVETFFIKYISS